jgi:putative endonuclease
MASRSVAVGRVAEAAAAQWLEGSGWRILGRNVRIGRNEVDLVALDPGPPGRLVAVEVRWRRRTDHGRPEETIDGRKVGRLRTAIVGLLAAGVLPDGTLLPSLPPAIDVITVEPGGMHPRIGHLRDIDAC